MGFLSRKTMGLIPLRSVILMGMLFSPILIYALCGAIAIWQVGWLRWLWWLAPLVWSITWVVSKLWIAKQANDESTPLAQHWTPRDRAASGIVRQHQLQAATLTTDQLSDPQFYFAQAISLANDLAKHYQLDSKDPVSDRTLPEILATCRLVADDLEKLVLESVPGSRLLTVNQWKKLGGAPKVVRELSKGFWATSVMLNPLSLASWGTSKVTNEKVTSNLQTELLVKLYMMFIRQLGFYLIEMNSGRLRAGADIYRSQFDRDRQALAWNTPNATSSPCVDDPKQDSVKQGNSHHDSRVKTSATGVSGTSSNETATANAAATDRDPGQDSSTKFNGASSTNDDPFQIRIAILGQRQVGKTSLISGLIGGAAELPRLKAKYGGKLKPTSQRTFHQLDIADQRYHIQLIDTPGYQHAETFNQLKREIRKAIQQAHAILWVVEPTRSNANLDLSILKLVRQKFEEQPNLKPPPIMVIGLTGNAEAEKSAEESAEKSAEESESVQALRLEMDSLVDDWIEIPTETQMRAYNLTENQTGDLPMPSIEWQATVKQRVLPVIHKHLETARTAAMLISYENLLNQSKYSTLFKQARNSGSKLLSAWFEKPPTNDSN